MQNLPQQIAHFIEQKIEFKYINDLPHFYPSKTDFDKFQEGYRFNSITKESLISTKKGGWNEDFYVICSNYYNDPFIINITEKESDFPVYFARHGEGKWNRIKISNSISDFYFLLIKIKETEETLPKTVELLRENENTNTVFWQELIEELLDVIKYNEEEEAKM